MTGATIVLNPLQTIGKRNVRMNITIGKRERMNILEHSLLSITVLEIFSILCTVHIKSHFTVHTKNLHVFTLSQPLYSSLQSKLESLIRCNVCFRHLYMYTALLY